MQKPVKVPTPPRAMTSSLPWVAAEREAKRARRLLCPCDIDKAHFKLQPDHAECPEKRLRRQEMFKEGAAQA